LIGPYLTALKTEAELLKPLFQPDTLYVGGGTPSLLDERRLEELFSLINGAFGPVKTFKESTFEINPESLTEGKAAALKTAEITRVSLGLQAVQNRLLTRLGRLARFEDFLKAFNLLRSAGFDNISVDLMTGLPGQSAGDFRETLDRVTALRPEHVSFYPLEIHKGTPFFEEGVPEEPGAAADMFEMSVPLLETAGFRHYEISNFARPGRESLHNLNYWDQGDYLGLGASAASHRNGDRWTNVASPERYISTAGRAAGPERSESETLSSGGRRAERIMLGLRKTAGIELPEDIFIEFSEHLAALSAKGLLEISGRRVKIKKEALYVSNAVFREFV